MKLGKFLSFLDFGLFLEISGKSGICVFRTLWPGMLYSCLGNPRNRGDFGDFGEVPRFVTNRWMLSSMCGDQWIVCRVKCVGRGSLLARVAAAGLGEM